MTKSKHIANKWQTDKLSLKSFDDKKIADSKQMANRWEKGGKQLQQIANKLHKQIANR